MIQSIEWLRLLICAALSAATLPLTLLLFVLTAATLFPRRKYGAPQGRIRLAALIPAHDEELLIARCVRSIKAASDEEDFAIYTIADNCSDRTAELAALAGARVLQRNDTSRRGKGFALQMGFDHLLSQGFNAVLVVDADSEVSPNLLRTVRHALEEGADAVQCRYRVLKRTQSIRRRFMDLALLGFNVVRPSGRDRLGLSAGLFGNGFALSAKLLRAVPYRADSVVEDLEYHIHLTRGGYKVRFANEATVYGEMPSGAAAAKQRARWEGGRLRMTREWTPRLAADLLQGKWRMTEPLIELFALPIGQQVALLALLFTIGTPATSWWATIQTAVLAFHVIAAAAEGESFTENIAVLAAAPFYIVWKLALIWRTLDASRAKALWVRSERQV